MKKNNSGNAVFILRISLIVLIVGVAILRFLWLEQSPPGFHVDELSGSVTVQCLAQEGIDALDNPYPLFADLNYGSPKPPTYSYPAILWTKIFGYSIVSFRALTVFIFSLALIGLIFLSRQFFGGQMALMVALAASLSPWTFQISRIALEALLAPCLTIWGLYFFLKSNRIYTSMIAGVLFALAMYSYPPARLQVPLIIGLLLVFQWKNKELTLRRFLSFVGSFVLILSPLVYGTLIGKYMGRFELIGIFSQKYLASIGKTNSFTDLAAIFGSNFLRHLTPDFLFFKGDQNFVYSTGKFGLLSWLDIFALLMGVGALSFFIVCIYRKRKVCAQKDVFFLLLVVWGIITGIAPSALTWQDIPHSLRILGMWPFLMLLSGYCLWVWVKKFPTFLFIVVFVAASFSKVYFPYYFQQYPKAAYGMFSTYSKDEVVAAKTDQDWLKFAVRHRWQNFHLRYYMMNYYTGQTCSSTQQIWKKVSRLRVK